MPQGGITEGGKEQEVKPIHCRIPWQRRLAAVDHLLEESLLFQGIDELERRDQMLRLDDSPRFRLKAAEVRDSPALRPDIRRHAPGPEPFRSGERALLPDGHFPRGATSCFFPATRPSERPGFEIREGTARRFPLLCSWGRSLAILYQSSTATPGSPRALPPDPYGSGPGSPRRAAPPASGLREPATGKRSVRCPVSFQLEIVTPNHFNCNRARSRASGVCGPDGVVEEHCHRHRPDAPRHGSNVRGA